MLSVFFFSFASFNFLLYALNAFRFGATCCLYNVAAVVFNLLERLLLHVCPKRTTRPTASSGVSGGVLRRESEATGMVGTIVGIRLAAADDVETQNLGER
jgi:hypothetical protein